MTVLYVSFYTLLLVCAVTSTDCETLHNVDDVVCATNLMQTKLDIIAEETKAKQLRAASSQNSAFTPRQERCISNYIDEVDAGLPGGASHLRARRWGGAGSPLYGRDPPILGVGFGSTGTRSLMAFGNVLGLKSQHYPRVSAGLRSLRDIHVLGKRPDGSSFTSRAECSEYLNAVNYSESLGEDFDMFLDTPMAEHFLDFYALSSSSKIVLTTRPAVQWVDSRLKFFSALNVPTLSPCGVKLADVKRDVAAQLMSSYETLVRCIVPAEKLFEISLFDGAGPSTLQTAKFLGKAEALGAEIPFPRISDTRSSYLAKKLGVCITGQLQRLELQSKVDHLVLLALKSGMSVHVALVLDSHGRTEYVHEAPGEVFGDGFRVKENPLYNTFQDTVGVFPKNVGLIYDWFVPRDIEVEGRYQLMPLHGVNGSTRVRSHARQWQLFDRCWRILEDGLFHMDHVVRVRDDLLLLSSFVPSGSLPQVVVPSCQSFYGLNDKFSAVTGNQAIKAWLQGPLDNMLNRGDAVIEKLHKPIDYGDAEIVLRATAFLAGLDVTKATSAQVSHVVTKTLHRGSKSHECFSHLFLECMAPELISRISDFPGAFVVEGEGHNKQVFLTCLPESISIRGLV
eukprot:TRINITY_DN3368_c0_g1_i1.p1 TRINITY_DN3368_c0_g1~~TRINITY_DN3368_c0_g1_i1.p1  ORF type:complete len:623 (-),score=55.37 TRINITY_DN3368_c0_g1_i1:152-2020(-)